MAFGKFLGVQIGIDFSGGSEKTEVNEVQIRGFSPHLEGPEMSRSSL